MPMDPFAYHLSYSFGIEWSSCTRVRGECFGVLQARNGPGATLHTPGFPLESADPSIVVRKGRKSTLTARRLFPGQSAGQVNNQRGEEEGFRVRPVKMPVGKHCIAL